MLRSASCEKRMGNGAALIKQLEGIPKSAALMLRDL